MRIGVVLRQVPDPEAHLEVDAATARVVEGSSPWVIDESDEAALDAALELAAASGGEVVAIALGPGRADQAARKALALGARRAIRIEADDPAPPDVRVTGAMVAAAARRASIDLLLAGAQSSAAGTGLVASASALALGWPWIWLVLEAELEEVGPAEGAEPMLRVVQELEARRRRRWRVRPPAVLAIQTGRYRARMPAIRGVLAARRAPIETLGAKELGARPEAPTPGLRRVALDPPAAATGVEWIAAGAAGDGGGGDGRGWDGREQDGAAGVAARRLVRRLREVGVL